MASSMTRAYPIQIETFMLNWFDENLRKIPRTSHREVSGHMKLISGILEFKLNLQKTENLTCLL